MIYISFASIILAIFLFYLAARQRKRAGIPRGRVIFVDSSQWKQVEQPLFDKNLRLTGRPDYLVQQGKQVIPIEVKSGKAPQQPHDWHVAQLAAYCLLVASEYGVRPDNGILHYADRTLAIDFSAALETATREIVQEIQKRTSQIQIERSHHEVNRCIHCGYRSICNQALRI